MLPPDRTSCAVRPGSSPVRQTLQDVDRTHVRLAQDHGDVPIGAVVLDTGNQVVAAAGNERELRSDPTGHAEVIALREAARTRGEWRLEGCTLVVTLEPCTMCAGALVLARVSRLVYAADDPKAGAVGSLWDVVRDRRLNSRPEVVRGVLAAEAADLLRTFFAAHRTRADPTPRSRTLPGGGVA